jgi:hypothetical protein
MLQINYAADHIVIVFCYMLLQLLSFDGYLVISRNLILCTQGRSTYCKHERRCNTVEPYFTVDVILWSLTLQQMLNCCL